MEKMWDAGCNPIVRDGKKAGLCLWGVWGVATIGHKGNKNRKR